MAEVVGYEGALCSPRQGKREPRLTVDREKMSYPFLTRKSIRVFVLN